MTEDNDLDAKKDLYPVVLKNSTIFCDNEGDNNKKVSIGSDGWASTVDLTNAAINVENSNDVVFGPVTQFHAPVTIYQNVPKSANNRNYEDLKDNYNGKFAKSESTSSDINSGCEGPPSDIHSFLCKHWRKMAIVAVLLIVTITATTLTTVLQLSTKDNEIVDHKNNTNGSTDPCQFINRTIWGGRPRRNNTVPLHHPTPLIIVSHTASDFCTSISSCSQQVRNAQAYHVSALGSPDVGYNFLIGGDSNIYIGRDWDIRNFHRQNSLGICFIGNYVFDELTPDMKKCFQTLLQTGVNLGKLSDDYKIVAHNQTFKTESPGVNVYKYLKELKHFTPRKLYD